MAQPIIIKALITSALVIKLLLQASEQLKEIDEQLKEQYKHTSQNPELLADLRYRDGIEDIEASFKAFWKGTQ
jgi:hypothetical protein